MSESNVVTPPDSFTIAILEAALAERDARIKALEAAIMKISEITKRNGRPNEMEKITQDFDAAMTEAEKLVGDLI